MAVDKLVDSTQLNTDLTSVANAIRTKGGTSGQLAFPAGFVSAVEAIPAGGGISWEDFSKACKALKLEGAVQGLLPSEITIDTENLSYFSVPVDWNIDSGLRTLTIKCTKPINFTGDSIALSGSGINITMMRNRGIKKIIFTNDIKLQGSLNSFFIYMYDLEEIYGDFDFTDVPSWTYGSWFIAVRKLTRIRLKENTAATISTIDFSALNALDNDSLISIANGLGAVESGHTLKLESTPKSRLMQIVGTVTLDPTETYHIFTESVSGSVTLQDFITTTKGWTIA